MLDLTKQVKNYELIWFDGNKYSFRKPTQEFIMKVADLESLGSTEDQIKSLINIVHELLNSNLEGKEFTDEDMAMLDMGTLRLILEDYMNSVYDSLGE